MFFLATASQFVGKQDLPMRDGSSTISGNGEDGGTSGIPYARRKLLDELKGTCRYSNVRRTILQTGSYTGIWKRVVQNVGMSDTDNLVGSLLLVSKGAVYGSDCIHSLCDHRENCMLFV